METIEVNIDYFKKCLKVISKEKEFTGELL